MGGGTLPNASSSDDDAEVDGPSRRPPPKPPSEWVWPREGDPIEVEVEEESGATTWEKAVVSAVLVDGWFQAHITTSGDAVGWAS